MLEISRRIIQYKSITTGRTVKHHVLIAESPGKKELISHPNLFLCDAASSSLETSNRYSNVISMFYRYLSKQARFSCVDISMFHVLASNKDIKEWQVARQVERVNEQRCYPTSKTIYEDAAVLLRYFRWIHEEGFVTNVRVALRDWIADFKSNAMLNYINKKSIKIISGKDIRVLDKERRQGTFAYSLIKSSEITALVESYADPVYGSLFKFGLGTAMRPMDLVRFPYIGVGRNKHILPYSDIRLSESKSLDYLVEGSKGNKSRTIKINIEDLRVLEEQYIKPYYHERREAYRKRYGRECPQSILFLNKQGKPVTPQMISSRTNDAKKHAIEAEPSFRESITFYDSRHWWPTVFLMRFFGDKLLTDSASVLYAAAAQVVKDQMGHEDLETTYKYYVDMARMTAIAHNGVLNEIVSGAPVAISDFVRKIDRGVNT